MNEAWRVWTLFRLCYEDEEVSNEIKTAKRCFHKWKFISKFTFHHHKHQLQSNCYFRNIPIHPSFCLVYGDLLLDFIMPMVGATGFEPATTWSQTRCATGLRYAPITALLIWTLNQYRQLLSIMVQRYMFSCICYKIFFQKTAQMSLRSSRLPRQSCKMCGLLANSNYS